MTDGMSTVSAPAVAMGRTEKLLAASRLFSGLERGALSDIARLATARRLTAGERLWSAGDPPTHFTLILSGLFKIIRTAADGTEAIVALFGPHESIGDVAVIGRRPYPAAAIVCSESAEILRVPAEPVLAAMNARPDFAGSMSRTLVEHTQMLQEKIRIMSAGSVPKRLATLLLGLAERFGDEAEDGSIGIPVCLSRTELACLIGARVETTIRTIRAWEKAGVVETTSSGFQIHQPETLVRATYARDDGERSL